MTLIFPIEESGQNIILTKATGPRNSNLRGRFFFFANRLAERKEIEKLHKSGLHYLGDWHTHPQSIPLLSSTYLNSMADLFERSEHELAAFVMIIVGTCDFPTGLHVSLHDAKNWSRLLPSVYN